MNRNSIIGLVLTYNEENILTDCLNALKFVDEIIVFDSFSTDNTLEIAKQFKAKVFQREFDNYAAQRNAALNKISSTFDWIVMVDADEIVTPELRDEILNTINSEEEGVTMYRVRRKDIFQKKWIKQSSGYPTWFPRVFKNGGVRVEREINEDYITTGSEGKLTEHLLHYPFNKGMTWWFAKHNKYSEMEAKKMLKEIKEPILVANLISKNPVLRRKAQKRLSYRLPFRPWLIFFAFYILKAGFLNGKAGYTFCKLRQTYEWMINLKFKEFKSHLKDK